MLKYGNQSYLIFFLVLLPVKKSLNNAWKLIASPLVWFVASKTETQSNYNIKANVARSSNVVGSEWQMDCMRVTQLDLQVFSQMVCQIAILPVCQTVCLPEPVPLPDAIVMVMPWSRFCCCVSLSVSVWQLTLAFGCQHAVRHLNNKWPNTFHYVALCGCHCFCHFCCLLFLPETAKLAKTKYWKPKTQNRICCKRGKEEICRLTAWLKQANGVKFTLMPTDSTVRISNNNKYSFIHISTYIHTYIYIYKCSSIPCSVGG